MEPLRAIETLGQQAAATHLPAGITNQAAVGLFGKGKLRHIDVRMPGMNGDEATQRCHFFGMDQLLLLFLARFCDSVLLAVCICVTRPSIAVNCFV